MIDGGRKEQRDENIPVRESTRAIFAITETDDAPVAESVDVILDPWHSANPSNCNNCLYCGKLPSGQHERRSVEREKHRKA